ncbi:MAG: PAS domain-containing protein [Pseudomonadota bacterium]|nr:PAS domain-containing protein [Pseudomonadota bacterium]
MFKLPENTNLPEALASFPGHLYLKDKEGRYLGGNSQFITWLKLDSVEELIGKTDYDLIPKDQADKIFENDQSVILEGVTKSIEEIVTDLEGHELIYLSHKAPFYDNAGNVIGLIGTSLDITNIIEKQQAFNQKVADFTEMSKRNRFMNSILWRLPEKFYWKDLESRIIACNEGQANSFGMTREEFIGLDLYELGARMDWKPEIAERMRQNDLQVINSGQPMVTEEELILGGKLITLLSYKNPLYDFENNLIGVYGFSVDITERKKMEMALFEEKRNAESANRAKTNFLMNMSHDIRTPFSGIIGNTEILLHSETSSEKKIMLTEILKSSEYLLELLNDIIVVTGLEDNHPIEFQSLNLFQSVTKMVTLMKLQATQKELYLHVNFAEDVPKYIVSNRKNIERILLNLLGNAIKFTRTGGVELSIRASNSNSDEVNLEFIVADTGIGIPPDKVDIIFDQFTRLSPAYEESIYQGSGLGLWIVKGLVDQLAGKIEVTSQLGRGSQFKVSLSCPLSEQPTESVKIEHYHQANVDVKHILVVDDDPIARKVAYALLKESFNAEITMVGSGVEALNYARQNPYDFILMDIGLPDINGAEVARIIKQDIAMHVDTPIIGLSAHTSVSVDANIMRVVLTKPFTYGLCQQLVDIMAKYSNFE